MPAQGAGAGQHTTVAAPPPVRTTGQHSTVAVPAQGGGMAPHPGAPMHMPMMGGGTAMVADGGHLYIVQGGMVFKVRKSDLNVERHQPLMHMPPNVMHPAPGRMPPPTPPARGGGGDKKD